ncbi:TAXI family TRAP transporter solute-binding subunit [Litorivicinus sp.]|nr:TAXI family TRAP transporter solute-binding subunit [Litorivicinus sp.]
MIKISKITAILALTLFSTAASSAQFVIGTSGQGTATYGIGSAMASVLAKDAGDQFVVQPHGGTGKIVPLVNTGKVDYSLANILEVANAVKGRGPFKGRVSENLRVVAVVYPFEVGFFVKSDSDIKTVADLKGRKVSTEYSGQKIIGILSRAVLANAGLSVADVDGVPVTNIIGNADDFSAGKTEAGFFAVGAGKMNQVAAAVGGIRFLPVINNDEAAKRMQKVVPPSYVTVTKPRKGLTGVEVDTPLMAYDYLLYAGSHVPDSAVAKLVAAMAKNRKAMSEAYGPLTKFDPANMAKDIGLPFHPGAESYYKAQGLWKR